MEQAFSEGTVSDDDGSGFSRVLNQLHFISSWSSLDPSVGVMRVDPAPRPTEPHIHCVAISPDGSTVASSSDERVVRVWSVGTGEREMTLQGHRGSVLAVAFSPDGEKIVSGSEDGTLRVWNAKTGECEKTLQGHTCNVSSVAISSDGATIVSGVVGLYSASVGCCHRASRHYLALFPPPLQTAGERERWGGRR